MRGKVQLQPGQPAALGITPACAGKSRRLYRAIGCSKGSPPRMRGKVLHQRPELCSHGITPAYAGKRGHRRFGPGTIRDHPRVCGEKGCCKFSSRNHSGSPPRVRGKVSGNGRRFHRHGITPACAGKRMVFAGRKSRTWDHPRVCGEKVSSTSPIKCLKGSPPRMRGKVPQPGVEGCRLGITPAYAGKRGIKLSIASMIWDHPRVCGEKLITLPIAR